jgi:alpha-tubulin suppressor-like RCC1 family protein
VAVWITPTSAQGHRVDATHFSWRQGFLRPVHCLLAVAIERAAPQGHACALLASGSVECWGYNSLGQFGNGTTTWSDTPVRVSTIKAPTRLAGGYHHACALFPDGAMRCWGLDDYGELGNRRKNNKPNPWPINLAGTPGVVWDSSDSSAATITDRGVATGRVGAPAVRFGK